jgi:hypothetical protein
VIYAAPYTIDFIETFIEIYNAGAAFIIIFDHTSEGGAVYFMQREKNIC